MSLNIRVSGRIGRPVADVFDAVVNPKTLELFHHGGRCQRAAG